MGVLFGHGVDKTTSEPNSAVYIVHRYVSTSQSFQATTVGEVHASRLKSRSSAIAEGPRDASCQLKSCQLSHNSAETTCTTSPENIEVMKLEIKPMCNKHVILILLSHEGWKAEST